MSRHREKGSPAKDGGKRGGSESNASDSASKGGAGRKEHAPGESKGGSVEMGESPRRASDQGKEGSHGSGGTKRAGSDR